MACGLSKMPWYARHVCFQTLSTHWTSCLSHLWFFDLKNSSWNMSGLQMLLESLLQIFELCCEKCEEIAPELIVKMLVYSKNYLSCWFTCVSFFCCCGIPVLVVLLLNVLCDKNSVKLTRRPWVLALMERHNHLHVYIPPSGLEFPMSLPFFHSRCTSSACLQYMQVLM